VDTGLRLCSSLEYFWRVRGHYNEGRRWLQEFLTRTNGRSAIRAEALAAAGVFASLQGGYEEARSLYEESLSISRERDDAKGVARSLPGHRALALSRGEYKQALALYEECLEIWRRLGRRHSIAQVLQNLGATYFSLGEFERARPL
jgi:tetratricopeptide (TPR) repeat protein